MYLASDSERMRPRLDSLIRPHSVAVIGASATRTNNGNVVVVNLRAAGFAGAVYPVHAQADAIEGYPALRRIADLPPAVDVAVVSVPAAGVLDVLRALDAAGVRSAIVMSNGFTAAEDAALRAFMQASAMLVQGPNCMGLLNVTDAIPLYTAIPSPRVKPGRAALVAQSGSAAISVMNSTDVGFSKVITSGSQFRLTAADFLAWLATDEATAVVGLVIESIPDADGFADAVDRAQANGTAVVVLKVGQSERGAQAAQAHTGALIRDRDATAAYVRRYGVPTVRDYDELLAAMESFARTRGRPTRNRIGVVGISGGEAALTCDLAEQMGVELASFTAATTATLAALLPGTDGSNPVDFGASVAAAGTRQEAEALDLIAADPGVDTLFVLQDAQHSLAWRSSGRYVRQCAQVAALGTRTAKPIVVVSSSGEALHPDIVGALAGTDIPLLRGLRPALAAMGCMGTWFARVADPRRLAGRALSAERRRLHDALTGMRGPVPADMARRLLDAYGLPLVRSAVAASADAAAVRADEIGYPLVAKVLSRDVPHRSEIGAVRTGLRDEAELRAAIAAIEQAVRTAVPGAVIEGYELQEELSGCIEAVLGFKATPPFGALVLAGTGGTLVELQNDRAFGLGPLTPAEADALVRQTRLGAVLGGYRNLMPVTDLAALSGLIANFSELAADMHDVLAECDLNPVMVAPGSGRVRLVDVLFVAGGA
jgi:acetyltransferase